MSTLYRCITDEDSSQFCHRISAALAQGWSLHGGPTMAFDAAKGVMRMGQAVIKEIEADYHPEMKLGQQ